MAQGEFTLEEIAKTEKSFEIIFKSMTKKKQGELLGEANDIFLFFDAARRHLNNLEGK